MSSENSGDDIPGHAQMITRMAMTDRPNRFLSCGWIERVDDILSEASFGSDVDFPTLSFSLFLSGQEHRFGSGGEDARGFFKAVFEGGIDPFLGDGKWAE